MVLCRPCPSLFWPCDTFLLIFCGDLAVLMSGLARLLALTITVLVLLVPFCAGNTQIPQPLLKKKKNREEEYSFDVHNAESAIDGFAGNGNFTHTVMEAAVPHAGMNAKFRLWSAVGESLKRGIPGAIGGVVQASKLWNLFCMKYFTYTCFLPLSFAFL